MRIVFPFSLRTIPVPVCIAILRAAAAALRMAIRDAAKSGFLAFEISSGFKISFLCPTIVVRCHYYQIWPNYPQFGWTAWKILTVISARRNSQAQETLSQRRVPKTFSSETLCYKFSRDDLTPAPHARPHRETHQTALQPDHRRPDAQEVLHR